MLRLDAVVAFALLTSPANAVPPADPAGFEAVHRPLQSLAVEWEILDPREIRYVLARPDDFAADLGLLRHRYQELEDAPGLCDCVRFPDREVINELLAFNRAYRQHLGVRQTVELSRWWEMRAALQETDHLFEVWDTLRDARCEYYYVTFRRQALKKLRDMVGDEMYLTGRLPPYVPLWRFQTID